MNNQIIPSHNNQDAASKTGQLFDNLDYVLWTYKDLSRASSIPVNTLHKLVMAGKLRPIKIGRSTRFDPKEAISTLKKGVTDV